MDRDEIGQGGNSGSSDFNFRDDLLCHSRYFEGSFDDGCAPIESDAESALEAVGLMKPLVTNVLDRIPKRFLSRPSTVLGDDVEHLLTSLSFASCTHCKHSRLSASGRASRTSFGSSDPVDSEFDIVERPISVSTSHDREHSSVDSSPSAVKAKLSVKHVSFEQDLPPKLPDVSLSVGVQVSCSDDAGGCDSQCLIVEDLSVNCGSIRQSHNSDSSGYADSEHALYFKASPRNALGSSSGTGTIINSSETTMCSLDSARTQLATSRSERSPSLSAYDRRMKFRESRPRVPLITSTPVKDGGQPDWLAVKDPISSWMLGLRSRTGSCPTLADQHIGNIAYLDEFKHALTGCRDRLQSIAVQLDTMQQIFCFMEQENGVSFDSSVPPTTNVSNTNRPNLPCTMCHKRAVCRDEFDALRAALKEQQEDWEHSVSNVLAKIHEQVAKLVQDKST